MQGAYSVLFSLYYQRKYSYSFSGGGFTAEDGDVVYLPYGAKYTYNLLSNPEDTRCYQIEYELEDHSASSMRQVAFSENPVLVDHGKNEICNQISELIQLKGSDKYLTIAGFYRLFSIFIEGIGKENSNIQNYGKITPAVCFLNENFQHKFSEFALAELCGLSISHLRRLFCDEFGMSPLRYRNNLLCNAAKRLLLSDQMSIGEIAELLEFESQSQFSRFFKRETGMSPYDYRALN